MKLPALVSGTFVQRDNRFRATVTVDGVTRSAHIANSGRLGELLVAGKRVWLAPERSPARRTPYDLLLVEHTGTLVSVDAQLPNRLWAEYLHDRGWQQDEILSLASERRFGSSRLDFCLDTRSGRTWMEVKSVTLVVGGVALFPDAPTIRGARHVRELAHAIAQGEQGAVVFVVQRADADAFAPHVQADPLFARALTEARNQGITVLAYTCQVGLEQVMIDHAIPVCLD
ncbi:MAG: DNA/RNA nuclease SfsA [Anaerolineae bacterium]